MKRLRRKVREADAAARRAGDAVARAARLIGTAAATAKSLADGELRGPVGAAVAAELERLARGAWTAYGSVPVGEAGALRRVLCEDGD